MRILILALLMLSAGCGCVSVPNPETAAASAVRIEIGDKVCSATAVAAHSLLTALHCLDGEQGEMTIDGNPTKWSLIAKDANDHALLHVEHTLVSVSKLGPKPARGAQVTKYGNPMGLKGLVIYGRVAGYMADGTLLADMTGYRGDSGAALFDSQGRIVGVVSAIGGRDAFYLVAAFPLAFTKEDWARAGV